MPCGIKLTTFSVASLKVVGGAYGKQKDFIYENVFLSSPFGIS